MERIRNKALRKKIMSPERAAEFIKDGMQVAASGFTPSGYPKALPYALAQRAQSSPFKIDLITGASAGDELDGALARAGVIRLRMPYQTNKSMRGYINRGEIGFYDRHLSDVSHRLRQGFLGQIDVAIIEALAVEEDGSIVLTSAIGLSPTAISSAKKVILEINSDKPLSLEGIHDIYTPNNPPKRKPIPIFSPGDRIGERAVASDPDKILAIVMTDLKDDVRELGQAGQVERAITGHLIGFLEREVSLGRLPENLLPLQSGVGAIANGVLAGLAESSFEKLTVYSEVIQDAVIELILKGKVDFASGTSFTLSRARELWLKENLDKIRDRCILRPMEITNNPEIIRRLGVIAMNTAIEVDIYGHVNSTHLVGSQLMNGIGGSGDFARNGYLSIFSAPSTALGGKVSTIVPMVSHVDHTEHDVDIIITEMGLADLRGKTPVERAVEIIENCSHPNYRGHLYSYLERAVKRGGHEPHLLEEALSWHVNFMERGSSLF